MLRAAPDLRVDPCTDSWFCDELIAGVTPRTVPRQQRADVTLGFDNRR
jgi:hypothetical protein